MPSGGQKRSDLGLKFHGRVGQTYTAAAAEFLLFAKTPSFGANVAYWTWDWLGRVEVRFH